MLAIPTPASHSYGLSPYDHQQYYNPYGTLAVGLRSDPMRVWSVGLEARHQSAIPVNDWGDNSIELSLTWRPFAD